jgi:hypothetical protein
LFALLVLLAAAKMPLEEAALVVVAIQNLSNLLFFRYLWLSATAVFCGVELVV